MITLKIVSKDYQVLMILSNSKDSNQAWLKVCCFGIFFYAFEDNVDVLKCVSHCLGNVL